MPRSNENRSHRFGREGSPRGRNGFAVARTRHPDAGRTRTLPDDFYDRVKPRLHDRIKREVGEAKRIIDIGCGSCDLVRRLAARGDREVIGVDISSDSFPSQRRSAEGVRFRCLKRSADRLIFASDASMDVVVAMWALHEMEAPRAVLAEAWRVLRPGGKLLVVEFPRDSLAQRLWDEDYYRPGEMRALLGKAGFERIRLRMIEQNQLMWVRGQRPSAIRERNHRRDGGSHAGKG